MSIAASRRARTRALLGDDAGSAVAEFTMVIGLLTMLVLSVIQLGIAMHVRNTVLDAAAEGARYASLVGSSPSAGIARTQQLIELAIGADYAADVTASTTTVAGHAAVEITVRATMPVLGLIGPTALEVSGHAAMETLG